MNQQKTGSLIKNLRLEKGLTQRQLGELLGVSDKTVSKWERGSGSPDISLISPLAGILNVSAEKLLGGELPTAPGDGGNMKNIRFFVCQTCGNVSLCTGKAVVTCCGRPLEALTPVKAAPEEKLRVEKSDGDLFITADHPMEKAHHIAFLAFAAGESVQLVKLYPEWDLQVRLPFRRHGTLFWYCTKHGLFYQYI